MNVKFENHSIHGKCIFLDNGTVSVGIPLDFGIRVTHFSFCGEENLFFEHPLDMTAYCTPEGWRHRGGHRIWIAPEGDYVYAPDNEPIEYKLLDNGIEVIQKEDPWLNIVKSLRLEFLDDTSVKVTNFVKNTGGEVRRCSVWGVTAMKTGGTEYIDLSVRDRGYQPCHNITKWYYTNLDDERVTYKPDGIELKVLPIDVKFKIGVGHPDAPVRYELGDTVFIKADEMDKSREYPDGNVSYETYLSGEMVELETLAPLTDIHPGETAEHTEIWMLERKASD